MEKEKRKIGRHDERKPKERKKKNVRKKVKVTEKQKGVKDKSIKN